MNTSTSNQTATTATFEGYRDNYGRRCWTVRDGSDRLVGKITRIPKRQMPTFLVAVNEQEQEISGPRVAATLQNAMTLAQSMI